MVYIHSVSCKASQIREKTVSWVFIVSIIRRIRIKEQQSLISFHYYCLLSSFLGHKNSIKHDWISFPPSRKWSLKVIYCIAWLIRWLSCRVLHIWRWMVVYFEAKVANSTSVLTSKRRSFHVIREHEREEEAGRQCLQKGYKGLKHISKALISL